MTSWKPERDRCSELRVVVGIWPLTHSLTHTLTDTHTHVHTSTHSSIGSRFLQISSGKSRHLDSLRTPSQSCYLMTHDTSSDFASSLSKKKSRNPEVSLQRDCEKVVWKSEKIKEELRSIQSSKKSKCNPDETLWAAACCVTALWVQSAGFKRLSLEHFVMFRPWVQASDPITHYSRVCQPAVESPALSSSNWLLTCLSLAIMIDGSSVVNNKWQHITEMKSLGL